MRFLVGSGFSEYGSETLAARKNLLGYQSENSLFALLRRANFFTWGLLPCFSCTTWACDTLPSKKKHIITEKPRCGCRENIIKTVGTLLYYIMQNTRTKAMKNFVVAGAEIFTWLRLILSSTSNILFLWDLSMTMTMTMGCGRSKSRSRSRRINFPGAGKV